MAIIGVSGKIGSGKDLTGMIIQYLIHKNKHNCGDWNDFNEHYHSYYEDRSNWKIKKFAYAVKQVCSILTGIPIDDFEKEEVKNSVLGEEWTQYIVDFYGNSPKDYADQSSTIYGTEEDMLFNSENDMHSTRIKKLTIRDLLQRVGTDAIRNVIHPDAWVNALFSQYKQTASEETVISKLSDGNNDDFRIGKFPSYPNWIITDVRFPNEYESIKQRDGIIIRVNRKDKLYIGQGFKFINSDILNRIIDISGDTITYAAFDSVGVGIFNINEREIQPIYNIGYKPHPSETALDNHSFDYTIDNNGTIEELIEKVREILIKEKVID